MATLLNIVGAVMVVEAMLLMVLTSAAFPINLILLPLAGFSFVLSRRAYRHRNAIAVGLFVVAFVIAALAAWASSMSVVGSL